MAIELFQQSATGSGFPVAKTDFVDNEIPAGTKNSVNKTFTIAYTPITGSLNLYLRGQHLDLANSTDGFTLSGTTITIGSAVPAPASNDMFRAFYRK